MPVVLFSTDGKYHGVTTPDQLPSLEIVRKDTTKKLRTCSEADWDKVKNEPNRASLCENLGQPV